MAQWPGVLRPSWRKVKFYAGGPRQSTERRVLEVAQRGSIQDVNESNTIPQSNRLDALRDELRRFAAERDWDQFHTPKNLAIALSVESAELLEHFQWLTPEESQHLTSEKVHAIRLEMADVLLYLVRLADRLGVDLAASAFEKIAINAKKYPVALAKSSAKKYTEL
jgi:NTP pyrophosphatase (non-canonical NTP hydrolase)